MKICTKCGETKILEKFAKDNRIRSGRASWCKSCVYKNVRKWVSENRERSKTYYRIYNRSQKRKAYAREWSLKRKYGLDQADYEMRLEQQGGGCAICGGQPNGKDSCFHVDHDHKTGLVRGFLCHRCNTGIGSLCDSPALLRKAALYLEDANGTSSD